MAATVTPFTPAEIAALNAAPSAFNPDEIAALNAAPKGTVSTTAGDFAKSTGTGFGRGVLESPGIFDDIGNLIKLGVGKAASAADSYSPMLAAIDEKYGTTGPALQAQARSGLKGDSGFGGQSIANILTRLGILNYAPQGDVAKDAYNVAHFAGNALPMGVGGIAEAGLTKGLGAAATRAATDTAIGTGAGVGSDVGRHTADALGVGDDAPWSRFALEGAGALAGGKVTGSGLNRSLLYDKPFILKDMKDAGVDPHFATDVNPNPGLIGQALSKLLPDRYGAQNISQNSARSTQEQLKNHVQDFLSSDDPASQTLQGQGDIFQSTAQQSIDQLKADTTAAYTRLNAEVPGTTSVTTTNTTNAINDLVNRAKDPAIKAILQTPMFQKYSTLLNKPNLDWSDMDILRQEVGAATQTADGVEQGLLKQLYSGIQDDMRGAAQQTPNGLELFNKASETARNNNDTIRDVLTPIIDKSPETIPGFLTQQSGKGSTRTDDLFSTPGFQGSQGDSGRWLLNNQAQSPDGFDLDKLMAWWNKASPEAKDSLTQDPAVADGMDRSAYIYGNTAGSRGLIDKTIDPVSKLDLMAGTAATGQAALAAPLAKLAQMPGMVSRFGTPVAGDMVGPASTYGLPAAGMPANLFPDIWKPEPQQEQAAAPTEPGKVQNWLGTVDRPTATAYIAAKLGPQVAAQIPTDADGFRAALFALSSDPANRAALTAGSGSAEDVQSVSVPP